MQRCGSRWLCSIEVAAGCGEPSFAINETIQLSVDIFMLNFSKKACETLALLVESYFIVVNGAAESTESSKEEEGVGIIGQNINNLSKIVLRGNHLVELVVGERYEEYDGGSRTEVVEDGLGLGSSHVVVRV